MAYFYALHCIITWTFFGGKNNTIFSMLAFSYIPGQLDVKCSSCGIESK